MKKYLEWYSKRYIKHLIIETLHNRETAFFDSTDNKRNTRNIRVHNTQHFDFWWEHLNASDKQYNIYRSLATFKEGLPKFSPDLSKRREEVQRWNETLHKEIRTYDLLLDFDAETHDEIMDVHKQVSLVKKQFDKHKIPYYLWFSGCGFHITIPHEALPKKSLDPKEEDCLYAWTAKLIKSIQQMIAPSLDISVIDHRRLQKIPYTLALYGEEEYVCLPLTDEQFKNFSLGHMKPSNVITLISLYNRGLLKREGDNDAFIKWGETLIKSAKLLDIING